MNHRAQGLRRDHHTRQLLHRRQRIAVHVIKCRVHLPFARLHHRTQIALPPRHEREQSLKRRASHQRLAIGHGQALRGCQTDSQPRKRAGPDVDGECRHIGQGALSLGAQDIDQAQQGA